MSFDKVDVFLKLQSKDEKRESRSVNCLWNIFARRSFFPLIIIEMEFTTDVHKHIQV